VARLKKISELEEAHRRCESWAKHSYDQGPGYPPVTILYKAMREREGAATRGKGASEFSPDDAEIDRIISKLPPVNKSVIVAYYLQHGINTAKAKRCGLSVTAFKERVDGALWVIWAWLKAGHCRIRD
jgi:DNA-directed RNA polymerase specialized sigma24 family protein